MNKLTPSRVSLVKVYLLFRSQGLVTLCVETAKTWKPVSGISANKKLEEGFLYVLNYTVQGGPAVWARS